MLPLCRRLSLAALHGTALHRALLSRALSAATLPLAGAAAAPLAQGAPPRAAGDLLSTQDREALLAAVARLYTSEHASLRMHKSHGFSKKLFIEALVNLLVTVGKELDASPRSQTFMEAYFARLLQLSTSKKLASRLRFLCRDIIDLRKNNWVPRREKLQAKKLDQVRADAAVARSLLTKPTTEGERAYVKGIRDALEALFDAEFTGGIAHPFPALVAAVLRRAAVRS
jgi:hypothetical protein